ncbi:hypothetical protein GJAV_G00227220 [Gymnothorax javanicus]|nr:hypothetical protein GJAV_G00227220 [Gymnothorax javanicus]
MTWQPCSGGSNGAAQGRREASPRQLKSPQPRLAGSAPCPPCPPSPSTDLQVFVIADMRQSQSKRISAQSKKNPKRSEEVEVPVEDRGTESERRSTVLQLSEQRLDEVKVSLEDSMDESEGSNTELQENAQMEQKVAALENRTLELEEAAQAISAEKADCEQKLASMSGTIDKLVLEKAEEKAEYEQRLAAMSETIEKQVLERTEIQKAECELKLAGISEIIAMLVLEKKEMQMEAMIELNAGVMAEPVHLSIRATAEREAQMDHNMLALEETHQEPQENFLSKERTHMDIKAHAVEKRTTVLVQAAQAISEESMEFREKSAATPDTIDLRLLTTTQEEMTATSTDPINIAPMAPGSRDPSSVQSNCSEQLKSQQPHQDGALTEEGAHEEPCSSCVSFAESLWSQWQDIHNRSLEIPNRGLDGEQEKQTAALDCSSVSQLQEEVRLPAPEQSPNPETPAVEEEMKTDHGQNMSETSDDLSLGPEPRAQLEKSLKLLNSDEWLMKITGLYLIYELAKHQPETLFPDRQDICRAVLREVLNPNPCLEDPDQEAVALNAFAVHLLALVESVPYEPEMHELVLSFSQLTQDTSEVVRSCAEKMLAVLSEHVEESVEFQEKSAIAPDTIDLRLLTTPQEEMTATSTDPINIAPMAPGSRDPSSVQSNCSEQLKSHRPHQDGALTEEGAHEDPCSSCVSFAESLWSQWQDIHNRSLEIPNRGLDGEQEKQTAALDCSSVSQLQEEVRLPAPEQSPNPETPAVEEEMKTDHVQNLSETSDELSLGPEPRAQLEKSLKLLNSDERLMKIKGLCLIYELAKHQPETLFPDRQDICRAVLREVLNPNPCLEDPDQEAVARECFAVHLLALVEFVRYEPEMHELVLSFSQLTQDTSEVVRSCAEKMLAVLSEHVEESVEFQEKSANTPDTIDLRLLTTPQEEMTATSTDPINIAPMAPGSRDPSSVQSNCSEQLKSQQPHQDGALTEEGAHEDPCSSCVSFAESLWSQWQDIHNRSLEIPNRGLDGEQEKQTAALDCSSVSQLQEEVRLPAPEQSPSPETPAVEEEMKTDHGQNMSETSDDLSLGPEPRAQLEKSLKLLNSDEWLMKITGLYLIYELAKHQPETLFPDRQDICRAVLREVLNPLDSVSAMALGTLADLLSLLKTYFDPFLDWVAGVLYLKAASDNETLQQLTNEAMDHMTRSCSPLTCMKTLLFILSNPCLEDPDQEAVVRECFAVHLLALVESVRYEPEMHELCLSVGQLTQDTSEVVRSCAEKMLDILSEHLEVSQLLDLYYCLKYGTEYGFFSSRDV